MTVVSLEQIKQLDIRVKKAVALIKDLTLENQKLKDRISGLETELQELKAEKDTLKAEEERLQVSIQGVIDTLDQVEEETAGVIPEAAADSTLLSPEREPEIETESGTAAENQTDQSAEAVSLQEIRESVPDEQTPEQKDIPVSEPTSADFEIETGQDDGLSESGQTTEENVFSGVQDHSETEEAAAADSASVSEDLPEENKQETEAENVQTEQPADDSEPEIINLDSTDGELPEEDNTDSFQSEFDIF